MKNLKTIMILVLLALLSAGCSIDDPTVAELTPVVQPSGAAIFANYMAMGNSLTAGYMDGGLIDAGQLNSYPALIARQMGYPAGSFGQPLLNFPGVGSTDTGDPLAVAGVLHFTGTTAAPVGYTTGTSQAQVLANVAALYDPSARAWLAPFSNLGVPGATTLDMTHAIDAVTAQGFDPATGEGANPYFNLVLRSSALGNSTAVQQVIARGPTFLTMWIGNNDILGGATNGDPEIGVNLTPATIFEQLYGDLLDTISNGINTRHGYRPLIVAANIPSITSIPYFMTPATFNAMLAAATGGLVTEAVTVETDVQFFRFPGLGYIGGVLGAGGNPFPLPSEWTLTTNEVTTVENLVVAFNGIIATACAARQIPLYDANTNLAGLEPMEATHFLALAGVIGPDAAAQTTLFSLDGVHPNNRGYGVVANGFLTTMNTALGTAFPLVDVDALVWDPTYGQTITAASDGGYTLAPESTKLVDAIFR